MPLTAAQITAFFEDANNGMAMVHDTVVKIRDEGIGHPQDLVEFDKDTLGQVAESLRKPGDRIANPDPNAPVGSTIPRPPYVIGAKSLKRLQQACDLVRYYETTGRPITSQNIAYPIIRRFSLQWQSLKDRREDDDAALPKVSRALPILKWFEAFDDFLSRTIGVRYIPLSYVVRGDANVPAPPPDLANGEPFSDEYGSVEGELIARASHTHGLFRDDNASIYH